MYSNNLKRTCRHLVFQSYFPSTALSVFVALPLLGTWAHAQSPNSPVPERPTNTLVDDSASGSDQSQAEEYLTRGPLHEAFAGPYEANATPSDVVEKDPPEPINELPPDHRPEGSTVLWISGYWAWDEDRSDFIWISGVWRKSPPGQRWIPGYWEKLDEGNRWISGFWASDKLAEVEYLPLPPQSLEQGASSPAPSEDYFYIPGNWVYGANDYQWQPGYWARSQTDWVWSPSQYSWTPSGCVYHQGYWDYGVATRGVVFAPVYYNQPVYQQANYSYRPRYAIDTGINLFVHLFVRPNNRQYYFGDYYGQQYSNRFQPWVTNYQQRQNYDPFYTHYQNRSRNQNTNILSWINNQHQFFANDPQYRPPQTIAAQQQFILQNQGGSLPASILQLATFGDSFDNVLAQKNSPLKFQAVSRDEEQQWNQSQSPLRELTQNRRKLERRNRSEQAATDSQSASVTSRTDIESKGKPKLDTPNADKPKLNQSNSDQPNSDRPRSGELDRLLKNNLNGKQDGTAQNGTARVKESLPLPKTGGETAGKPDSSSVDSPISGSSVPTVKVPAINDNPAEKLNIEPTDNPIRKPLEQIDSATNRGRDRQRPSSNFDPKSMRPGDRQDWPSVAPTSEKPSVAPPTSPEPNTTPNARLNQNPSKNPQPGAIPKPVVNPKSDLPNLPPNRAVPGPSTDARSALTERLRQPENMPRAQPNAPSGNVPSQNVPKVNTPSIPSPERPRGNRPDAPKAPKVPGGPNKGSNPLKAPGEAVKKSVDLGIPKL